MAFLYWNISMVLTFCCVFIAAGELEGELPAPVDVKLEWESEFCPKLTWTKPSLPDKCEVNFTKEQWKGKELVEKGRSPNTTFKPNCMSREQDVTLTITTTPRQCGNHSPSKPVTMLIPRNTPDVVKNFRCVYYAYHRVNCTWEPSTSVIDLKSWFSNGTSPLRPCLPRMPAGCHASISDIQHFDVFFLINGTQKGTPVKNTFHIEYNKLYKPLPPEVSIDLVDEGKKLKFSWNQPDFTPILHCFHFQLNYTECNNEQPPTLVPSQNSTKVSYSVPYDSKCQYTVKVRSMVTGNCGKGGSEPSQVQVYGSTSSDLQMVVVAICLGVPMCVAALLFFFVNKYKEKVLPKIPEPRLDSVKGLMVRLYVPTPERVEPSLEMLPTNTDGTQLNMES